MKRVLRGAVLTCLVLIELWLLSGFLPDRWQERTYQRLNKIWPSNPYDYSRITHPNLDKELEPFQPLGMVLIAILSAVNGVAIVKLWRVRDAKQ